MSHQLLFANSSSFGFQDSAVYWTNSYLVERLQMKKVGTVNDLGDLMFFANGKTYYSCGCTPEEATLGALHTFSLAKEWFADNWLTLNGLTRLKH